MSASNSDVAVLEVDSAATLRQLVSGKAPLIGSSEVLSSEVVFVLNTGTAVEPEKWRERKLREQELLRQTERLADILERNGIPAYTKSESVYAVGLVTGDVERLQRFRAIRFLPTVAKRERAPMLNELRHFQRSHPSHRHHMRFGVLTSGPRVRAGADGELRNALKDLHRTISRWSQWAEREHGIEVVGRFSEITVQKEDEEDIRTVHPHANILYTPRTRLTKRQWTAFLKGTSERFGSWWKDCGVLEAPDEAIKYVAKPADLNALSESEIVWLFHELYRMKLAQPMGPFQAWRREKLCARRDTGWYQDRKVVSVHVNQCGRLSIVSKKRRKHVEPDQAHLFEDSVTDRSELSTRLMGFTLPQRRATPFAEPYALIRTDLAPTTSGTMEFLDRWQHDAEWGDASKEEFQEFMRANKAARRAWDINRAPEPEAALRIGQGLTSASEDNLASIRRFIVHTCRPTARLDSDAEHVTALADCLNDTERIKTVYSDLELEYSERKDFGGVAAIRRLRSQITPLYSAASFNS